MFKPLELSEILPVRTWKIKLLKTVCLTGGQLTSGSVHTVSARSTLSGPNFNGALFSLKDYPYRKFLWHDEFEIVKEII